jgi:catechol 2,3-dioxygenase-like lactoylglutathione lyase family enzyme
MLLSMMKLSHVTVFVPDQDAAQTYYVDKLGFELKMNIPMGGWRWLTVAPPGETQVQLALVPVKVAPAGPLQDEATCAQLLELLKVGRLGTNVFETDDCQKTYDEMVARGAEFTGPPKKQFYGIEAMLKDPFGNKFSVVQRTEQPPQ